MPGYLVRWQMLVTAETEVEAAQQAAAMARDPESPTIAFDVLHAYDLKVVATVNVPHPVRLRRPRRVGLSENILVMPTDD